MSGLTLKTLRLVHDRALNRGAFDGDRNLRPSVRHLLRIGYVVVLDGEHELAPEYRVTSHGRYR